MKPRRPRQAVPVGDTDPFEPTPARPVRCRARAMGHDTQFEPHHHPWGQLACCASGLLQVTVAAPSCEGGERPGYETTTIVPPSRAVWIPPGARHAVTMLEASQLHTLYIDASVVPADWRCSRVLVVSPLLRELVRGMDQPHAQQAPQQQALATLVLTEIANAPTQPLGVPMPDPQHGDRRLRALCEAVMNAPALHANLAAWAAHSGASERTLARLFREELGTGFHRWRQQVVLAHALPMLARGTPVSQVAAASGYASDSAFTAMFRAALGQPPTRFGPRFDSATP
jgi:AraC-like DNA-binding protein